MVALSPAGAHAGYDAPGDPLGRAMDQTNFGVSLARSRAREHSWSRASGLGHLDQETVASRLTSRFRTVMTRPRGVVTKCHSG